MKATNKRIVLGSGMLYCTKFEGTIPQDSEIEKDANVLGLIKGGASVSYEGESYTATDDLGLAVKKMLTKETVVLKSGLITWNGSTLAKLCQTARVSESDGKRTVKIGGVGNYNSELYLLRFVHTDAADGDIRLTIVGTSEGGFEFAFAKDEETTLDVEFTAQPSDDEGTLLIFEETVKAK